jgi:hypothetical protein
MNEPIFTSRCAWNPERIHALAIYCSDGRWGEAFDDFCQQGLGLPRYDRFAVPGGPAWLTLRDVQLLRPYDVAREHVGFLVRAHELERIVLVTHYGCAFYGQMLGLDPDGCLPAQEEDLRAAGAALRAWFPRIEVHAYLAIRDGDRFVFRQVPV